MAVPKERIVHGIIWVRREVSPPLKARLPKSLQGLVGGCWASWLFSQYQRPKLGLQLGKDWLSDAYSLAHPRVPVPAWSAPRVERKRDQRKISAISLLHPAP